MCRKLGDNTARDNIQDFEREERTKTEKGFSSTFYNPEDQLRFKIDKNLGRIFTDGLDNASRGCPFAIILSNVKDYFITSQFLLTQ